MAPGGTGELGNLPPPPGTTGTRVVLVHDWLTGHRGGEKCLALAARRFPRAELFTLLHAKGSVPAEIERLNPRASFLNRLPGWRRYYRYLLPLMPLAANWRIPPCDVVLSFSHCVAKAARPPRGVPHVCYCFSPMRYAWQMRSAYFAGGGVKEWLRDKVLAALRAWDRRTASRVTHFVAISRTVQNRVKSCYGRDSVVIYPPVDTAFYTPSGEPRGDFYLIVSALAPYKRFELAVTACERLGREVIVIGRGPGLAKINAVAGPRTQILGYQPDEVVRDYFRRCRALLFPGEEDFGIAPVEAMACGTPVIAYGTGGVAETVIDGKTGVLFVEQSVQGVVAGIERFEAIAATLDPTDARRRAEEFAAARYERELFGYVEAVARGGVPKLG